MRTRIALVFAQLNHRTLHSTHASRRRCPRNLRLLQVLLHRDQGALATLVISAHTCALLAAQGWPCHTRALLCIGSVMAMPWLRARIHCLLTLEKECIPRPELCKTGAPCVFWQGQCKIHSPDACFFTCYTHPSPLCRRTSRHRVGRQTRTLRLRHVCHSLTRLGNACVR